MIVLIDLSQLEKLEAGDLRRQVRALVNEFARAERLPFNTSEHR